MLSLVNLAVVLSGAMFLSGVAAVPAPHMPTTAAIIPIITATETYIDINGSLTTATITISKFTSGLSENIAVYPWSAIKNTEAPIPKPTNHHSFHQHSNPFKPDPRDFASQAPTHRLSSSAFIGIPTYTHHASGRLPSTPQDPNRLIAEVAYGMKFTSYSPAPLPTHYFAGMSPHGTKKPQKKPSTPKLGVPITKSDSAATHNAGFEGTNNE